jgi:invasion protein IalB
VAATGQSAAAIRCQKRCQPHYDQEETVPRIIAIFSLLLTLTPLSLAAQSNEDITRREVGDWSVICTSDGSQCAMQQIGRTAQGEDALLIELNKYPEPQTAEGRQFVARGVILVPLGVILPPQIGLNVDGNDLGTVPFFRCTAENCQAQVQFEQNVIDRFIQGVRARFTYVLPAGQGEAQQVSVEISLSGFTRAYNSLP